MAILIIQIFIPFTLWEDYHSGMWRYTSEPERSLLLKKAILFTGNAKLYGKWMIKVIKNWPFACAHNLSNLSINRQAWIGHAACSLSFNCPEDITRLAWHYLSQKQQDDANEKADTAISIWETMLSKGIKPCLKLD